MHIAFCITCKGRVQHVQRTLCQNIQDNLDCPTAFFVLLDYNSDDGLQDYVQQKFQHELAARRLVYYKYRDAVAFRMAHAKNMAHRLGILEGADILVNLDADNFTGPGFACYLREQFTRTKDDPQEIFMWSRMVKGELPRGINGRIAITKTAFLISGGYDEKYDTYSPDDKDFLARLRRLGYCAQEIDARYLTAITHNDKLRFKEYPERQGGYDASICQVSRVVNSGSVGCGVVYRNFAATPTVLARIPTRIFGIGLHKTATSSLHAALQILGYKSGHWENAHWAKAIWSDVTNLGRSPVLDRYYALSDLPIPLLFRQLDRSYPGSKFILTVRDEAAWLRSVAAHFDPAINKFQAAWDNDPFTHRVHTLLYGRRKFDREIFLRRYRQHNADVVAHFQERPGDLLVLNMRANSGEANWASLCQFLDVPLPAADYPVRMVTGHAPCTTQEERAIGIAMFVYEKLTEK